MKKLMLNIMLLLSFVTGGASAISFGGCLRGLWRIFPAKMTFGAGVGYTAGRIVPGFYKSEEFKNKEYKEYVNKAHADQLFSDEDKEALLNKENKTSLWNTFLADMFILYARTRTVAFLAKEELLERLGVVDSLETTFNKFAKFDQQESKEEKKNNK